MAASRHRRRAAVVGPPTREIAGVPANALSDIIRSWRRSRAARRSSSCPRGSSPTTCRVATGRVAAPRPRPTRSSTRSTSTAAARRQRGAPIGADPARDPEPHRVARHARRRDLGRTGPGRERPGRRPQPYRQRVAGLLHRRLRAAARRARGPAQLPACHGQGDAARRAGSSPHRLRPAATRDTPADRRPAHRCGAAAPFPQQGLPARDDDLRAAGHEPGRAARVHGLQAELPVAPDGTQASAADVVFVVRRADDGRVMASGTDVDGASQRCGHGPNNGARPLQCPVRLAGRRVPDAGSGPRAGRTTGTVDRRFEVRALDGVDVTASDLIIGRRQDRLPVRPVSYVEEGLAGAHGGLRARPPTWTTRTSRSTSSAWAATRRCGP